MSGTVRILGSLTLGSVIPLLGLAASAVSASATLALGDIKAKIVGLLNVQAALLMPQPPTLAIAGAVQAVESLRLTLSAPNPTPQVAAVAGLLTELQTTLVSIQAQVAFGESIGNLLGASVAAYTYDGTTSSLGSSLAGATATGLPGGTGGDHCNAIILATSEPASWLALKQIFGL